MNPTTEYFEKNGYVVLQNALTKDQCSELTKYMFDLYEKGHLTKDDQCPLSDSIYGSPVFDDLLQKFTKPIGDSVGRTLLPTYTYARIYRPGEVLKKHKDRPACEISATLTLGYDAEVVWPIFFDEEKEVSVNLEVGELAVYKGCDIVHWRPAFKGNWHVQVFLHYVDANGPYKNEVRDRRPEYGTEKKSEYTNYEHKKEKINASFGKPIYDGVMIPKYVKEFPGYFCIDNNNFPELKFTPEECEKIIAITKTSYPISAGIGTQPDASKITKQIRSADIFGIDLNDKTRWIFEKIAISVSIVNSMYFDYVLNGITHSLQLIRYSDDMEVKGHYDWHVDVGGGEAATRKISFTAQLSDPSSYEGCELIINNHAHTIIGTKERGSIHMFPSYMLHKVNQITKGERYALVIWIHGPERFR